MKKLAAICTVLAALATPAFAQSGTAKTKAALTTEINTSFADNTTNAITAGALRQVTLDMVQSWVDYMTCAGTGLAAWSAGTPACLTTGTGVTTALGVNVGTAGAFVVNGGALGTPASGVATNLTGLPVSTGLAGSGTGVTTALGVNVGTAGAFVVNGGALGTPASGVATQLTGTASGLTAGNVSGTGVGSLASLAINGATIGTYGEAVTGAVNISAAGATWVPPVFNYPGYAPSALIVTGNSNSPYTNGILIAGAGTNTPSQLVFSGACGTLQLPTACAGAGNTVVGMNYVGGSVADYRTFTVMEFGNRGGAPTAEAHVQGRIQLGAVNGNISLRPGIVVYNDSLTVTNQIPGWFYNTGHANVFDGNNGNYERGELSWSGNIWNVGPTAAGTGVSRTMNLQGAAITHSAPTTVNGTSFGLTGSISAPAWTTSGVRYKNVAATLTDTTSSGTVAVAYTDVWGGNTIAASSAATFTSYYGSYFTTPIAGSNVTFTNKSALGADSISIGGAAQGTTALAVAGTALFGGNTTFNGTTNNFVAASVTGTSVLGTGSWMSNDSGRLIGYNAGLFGWASTSSVSGSSTADTTVCRQAAGVVEIGTTACNALGSLLLTNITPSGAIIHTGITSDATHTDAAVCEDTTTHQYYSGSGTLGVCLGTSGRQFKTAFAPMAAGLSELMNIKFINYRYKDGWGDNGARMQYGTTAQDVEAILPDLARQDANGETINYDSGALLFIGLRAIQQLKADNDNLRAEVEALKRNVR